MTASLSSFRWMRKWVETAATLAAGGAGRGVGCAGTCKRSGAGIFQDSIPVSGALLPAGLLAIALAGCGTPGLPRAPSLELPEPVAGLTAIRTGNTVRLGWITPRESTDKLPLRGRVGLRVCRAVEGQACGAANSFTVGSQFEAGVEAEFRDVLPAELTSGPPRLLAYSIELLNHAGKSAGASNVSYSAAGMGPGALRSLAAEVRADGVLLRWEPVGAADQSAALRIRQAVRIHRSLVAPPTASPAGSLPGTKPAKGKFTEPGEVAELTMLVGEGAGQGTVNSVAGVALDAAAVLGRTYIYRAERLFEVAMEGHSVEIAGEASAPVTVVTRDVFPPAVPNGLVALTVPEEHAIDLSWEPDTEADLAGYLVYRREAGGVAARISTGSLIAASYRDAEAVAGRRYRYSVSAIDRDGNESARSPEVEEGLPAQ